MNHLNHTYVVVYLFVFLPLFSSSTSITSHQQFFQCLSKKSTGSSNIFNVIYTPNNPSYASILDARIQNTKFNTTDTPKPLAILTPLHVSHIQATVLCARKHNLEIRTRSGGHDYEGLSFVSSLPFVVLDLINIRNITVDVENKVAWVESGATIGEFYYRIAEKSRTLAFPAGLCPTVGVGGHFSGGGYGILMRKYGLAADNVVDAILVDVNGRVLDRASMGEDLFWAIRGGGGDSFGVVISWKVNLVPVPPVVTSFSTTKSLDHNTTQLFNKWQYVASKLPHDITIFAELFNVNSTRFSRFVLIYLGGIDSLIPLMEEKFPELGVTREHCRETSYIEGLLSFAGYPSNTSLDVLLGRTNTDRRTLKGKSDYVKEPIPEAALEGLIKRFADEKIKNSLFFMVPYGGKMDEIAETSTPFPHRFGNLYMITYIVSWNEEGAEAADEHLSWIREVYRYMAPYVSKNPREAYFNYRDLDIGTNNLGTTTYKHASIWGTKYFKNNFHRLVQVKTSSDPSNFLKNEQSIPPLLSW